MKLHLANAGGANVISGYGADYVTIAGTPYRSALVVLPERLITDWPATRFATLTAGELAPLAVLEREIILLGTGPRLRFPRPEVLRPLIEAGIGVEVMDLPAACRTYNILVAEDRKVAAALLFE